MAAVTKNDIRQEAAFMPEFWKLVKQFWIPEDSDDYWDGLAAAISRLHERFPSDFCKKQLLAYMDYLDCKARDNGEGRQWVESARKNNGGERAWHTP